MGIQSNIINYLCLNSFKIQFKFKCYILIRSRAETNGMKFIYELKLFENTRIIFQRHLKRIFVDLCPHLLYEYCVKFGYS